jgi:hypothetical protein
MQAFARRHETAGAAVARARGAYVFGPMANASWSIGLCTIVPTTDHKQALRRPTVIPT